MAVSGHAAPSGVLGTGAALCVVAGISVVLRMYTRLVVVRNGGLDDACIVAGMILSITMVVILFVCAGDSTGRHMDALSPHQLTRYQQSVWASNWLFSLTLGTIKCSLLLQYLRIFPQSRIRLTCILLIAFIVIFTLWSFLSALLACVPVAHFWDSHVHGHCLPRIPIWYTNVTVSIVTDIITAVLPLPVLRDLKLQKRQRRALMIIFSLGGLTCIISVLRLVYLYGLVHTPDPVWDGAMTAICSNVEVNLGIICSCLPTLRGLASRVFPRLLSDFNSPSRIVELPDRRSQSGLGGVYAGPHGGRSIGTTTAWTDGADARENKQQGFGIQKTTMLEQDVDIDKNGEELSLDDSESIKNLILGRGPRHESPPLHHT